MRNFQNADKGYLKKRDEDPNAVILLGDSAYHRSLKKHTLGLGLPVPLSADGVQLRVSISSVSEQSIDVLIW
jgi:hypothetical protein